MVRIRKSTANRIRQSNAKVTRQPKTGAPIQAAGGAIPIRYLLTSDWSGGTATATIFDMDGNTLVTGATLRDPENVFYTLGSGNRGYGTRYNGKYYANHNAECPVT